MGAMATDGSDDRVRDERVRAAIDHWAPRFVANGVDLNDFRRVTEHVERWEDWCSAWMQCGQIHTRLGEAAEAAGNFESAAEHFFHAAMAYHFGKFLFVDFPDQLRKAHDLTVASYARALPNFAYPGERLAIPYEGGATLWGILRKPWHVARPPVVILVPGLDSVKEELHAYGDTFLRRGIAVLAIDGPGQGEMEFTHPMRHDYEVPVRYIIDALERRPDLDARRMGLFGVSLGGYYAVRTAAFEPRLRAIIALAGPYAVLDGLLAMPSLTQAAFTARLHARSRDEAVERLQRFTLSGIMERVQCPLLVIMGQQDRIVPPQDAERTAREAGEHAELWMFPDGNHVCNNIPYKHRPQQADWMRGKLGA
jgi:2,6-dihydroxypseudooxynicotine hydrolase